MVTNVSIKINKMQQAGLNKLAQTTLNQAGRKNALNASYNQANLLKIKASKKGFLKSRASNDKNRANELELSEGYVISGATEDSGQSSQQDSSNQDEQKQMEAVFEEIKTALESKTFSRFEVKKALSKNLDPYIAKQFKNSFNKDLKKIIPKLNENQELIISETLNDFLTSNNNYLASVENLENSIINTVKNLSNSKITPTKLREIFNSTLSMDSIIQVSNFFKEIESTLTDPQVTSIAKFLMEGHGNIIRGIGEDNNINSTTKLTEATLTNAINKSNNLNPAILTRSLNATKNIQANLSLINLVKEEITTINTILSKGRQVQTKNTTDLLKQLDSKKMETLLREIIDDNSLLNLDNAIIDQFGDIAQSSIEVILSSLSRLFKKIPSRITQGYDTDIHNINDKFKFMIELANTQITLNDGDFELK